MMFSDLLLILWGVHMRSLTSCRYVRPQCRRSGRAEDRGDGENAEGGAAGESQTYWIPGKTNIHTRWLMRVLPRAPANSFEQQLEKWSLRFSNFSAAFILTTPRHVWSAVVSSSDEGASTQTQRGRGRWSNQCSALEPLPQRSSRDFWLQLLQ